MAYYVLLNPFSANGKSDIYLNEFKTRFNVDLVNIIDITTIENMIEFLEERNESDEVVIIGGDGTINRFINMIKGYELKNNIYLFAGGTGNDFIKDVKDESINDLVLLNPYLSNLPTVSIDGEESYFINGVGFGLDGYCCTIGLEKYVKKNRPANYTKIALSLLFGKYKFRNATVTVDGVTKTYKKVLIAPSMKGRYYGGGLMIAPNQDRSGEELSLVVIHNAGRLRVLTAFPSIFKGKHLKYKKIVDIIKGKEITVEFDNPSDLQIDGEARYNIKKYSVHA